MASKHNQARSDGELNRERELKLECELGDIGKLLHHPVLRRATALPQSGGLLRTTYFDTPELLLQKNGVSLRVRQTGKKHLQTIKTANGIAPGKRGAPIFALRGLHLSCHKTFISS